MLAWRVVTPQLCLARQKVAAQLWLHWPQVEVSLTCAELARVLLQPALFSHVIGVVAEVVIKFKHLCLAQFVEARRQSFVDALTHDLAGGKSLAFRLLRPGEQAPCCRCNPADELEMQRKMWGQVWCAWEVGVWPCTGVLCGGPVRSGIACGAPPHQIAGAVAISHDAGLPGCSCAPRTANAHRAHATPHIMPCDAHVVPRRGRG